ncbi:MAG: alpha-L-arabinofuranosidase C-terminal domain-containing protein [Planctomycetaceae bacterium]|nr:hypothetical protein [Planctomycetaceae bacterium]
MTSVIINPRRRIGRVHPHIFGSFIENLNTCIYGGVYDPSSPAADADGFRTDVIAAARAMGISIVRFPGGCFAPFYHWKDGVGPRAQRPRTLYRKEEWPANNEFGTDEFVLWCRKVGAEPFICVNMGSGTPEEARDWVEYCNVPSGSRWADLRRANGHDQPHNVKYWALGNEISGNWEFGHAETPEDYIRRTREYCRAIKHIDPSVKLVLAGSHFPLNHAHADWNRKVVEELWGMGDYISMHHYIGLMGRSGFGAGPSWKDLGPVKTHLRLSEYMMEVEEAFGVMRSAIRLVQHRKGSLERQFGAALTEYNPWYRCWGGDPAAALAKPYTLSDALLVAAYFNAFIRNADVATLANMAQLVNVLPALMARPGTADFFRQTISYAQEMFLPNRGRWSVDAWADAPTYKGEFFPEVPYLDVSASVSEDGKTLVLNVANRDVTNAHELTTDVLGCRIGPMRGRLLTHCDIDAQNSFENPTAVVPQPFDIAPGGKIGLPPTSLVVLEGDLS